MPYKRIHLFYSGRVQGVGFRYAVRRIALGLGLVGRVKNLSDGKVEVLCEGDKVKLQEFLDNVSVEFPEHYIRDAQLSWEEPTHEFKHFTIIF